MSTYAAGTYQAYFPGHIAGITCWCRPRLIEDDEHGCLWLHRNVILRPDREPRCFQSVLVGPPVP